MTKKRSRFLTTLEQARLDQACFPVRQALGTPYLVGTVLTGQDWRDVDVRVLMKDEDFDAVFGGREALWAWVCQSTTAYLADATGLPIDFQVQRRSEANEKYPGPRSALGIRSHYTYAGGGDATPQWPREQGWTP